MRSTSQTQLHKCTNFYLSKLSTCILFNTSYLIQIHKYFKTFSCKQILIQQVTYIRTFFEVNVFHSYTRSSKCTARSLDIFLNCLVLNTSKIGIMKIQIQTLTTNHCDKKSLIKCPAKYPWIDLINKKLIFAIINLNLICSEIYSFFKKNG